MTDTGLRSRRHVHTTLTGIAVGTLLAGLALPWIVGEKVSTTSAGTVGAPRGEASDMSFDGTGTTVPPDTTELGVADESGSEGRAGATAATTASGVATSSPRSASVGSAGGGATDVGVTPTSVKVGFLLLDIGNVSRLGVGIPGVDPKQQEEAVRVHVDDVNERGGVAGRRIEPFFRAFDVLSQDDMRAACLAATEDAKVFAVIAAGGYEASPGLCITEEHKAPLVLHCCATDEFFARSQGRMFTLFAGATRLMHMWIHELEPAAGQEDRRAQRRALRPG